MKVLVAQSCPTLCDPMDCSPPGSSVHGILQARMLEWVAAPFSRGSSQPRGQTWIFCIAGRFFTICATKRAKLLLFRKKKNLCIYLAVSGLSCCVLGLRCSAHGLSCFVASGILVPWPGMAPASPALQGRFPTPGPAGTSPQIYFLRKL